MADGERPLIQVIDEIVAGPGEGRALLDDYIVRYAPGARARGMVLEQVLVSPPLWLDDQSNTLSFRWSLKDTAAWWQMRAVGGNDADVAAWWAGVDARVVSRRRLFASDPADIGRLGDA